ncbi:glycosyltransferase family 4 protein [Gammaproteobacteria bacterium]|nr:glycosyltransferase family 4 protein [Gammaproteobacteria bacterium]
MIESKKKINILFPYNSVGGAFRSTYEICNRLTKKGYDIVIYFPLIPLMENKKITSVEGLIFFIRSLVRNILRSSSVKWFNLECRSKQILYIGDRFIRDADVIIANHWPTAFPVHDLNPSKGKKFYFIRDIEQWSDFYHLEKKCFQLPMSRLVTTEFISNFLADNLELDCTAIIRNGFNFEDFKVSEKKFSGADCTISMIYSDHPMKGIKDGIKCLQSIKKKFPSCTILLFGFSKKPKLDFDFKFIRKPVKEELREVYASTDIFLCPSLQEGWHNPPSEAMAAKCSVVATNVGSVPYTIEDSVNGYVVEPGDFQKMDECISKLILDRDLRISISEIAYKRIQNLTWDDPVDKLNKIFTKM